MAGMNLNLLAGLVEQMNRLTEMVRIRKILAKKPENRTQIDLELLMSETQGMLLLTKRGDAEHKDMCYGLELMTVNEGDIIASTGLPARGECYCMIMSGRIWVETKDTAPFNSKTDKTGEKKKTGSKDVTEEDMAALFASIDVDGSGAIDVEELQYALEMMGMIMSINKVQELMDSVDDDGSGELEFPEFKLILTEKLGIGRQSTTNWETKDGKSSRYLGEGAVFGEESVTGTAGPMVGKVMGIEDADIVLITKAMFNHIKDHGFGGDLTRKRELLREHSVVKKCLKRSDLKRIAHSCTLEEIPAKKALCSQGAIPTELIFLCGGVCKVQERREMTEQRLPDKIAHRKTIKDLRKDGAAAHRSKAGTRYQVKDLALLQAGDLVAYHVLLEDQANSHTVMAMPGTTILRLQKKDLMSILHPSDLEALREECTTITERRGNQSETNETASKLQTRRMSSIKQVASVLDMIDDMSKGGGEDIRGESHHAGAHRRMDLIRRIVDKGIDLAPGLRGNDDLSTRVEELAEMHEAANSRSGTGAVTLDNLSTIPRKLEQQLKPNMSRNLRDSKSKKWKALQHSMSVLQHMKKTSSSTMQDLSLDEMVNAIQAGQVSLEALLAAFQRVRTTQPRVELDDVFTEAMESNASLLRSPSRHANIWTSGMQRSIQPPPRGRPMRKPVLPQDAGPGLRLPQLLTPREKGSVQHVNSIHVDAVAPKEAKKSATHGAPAAADFTAQVMAEVGSEALYLPWKKEKPRPRQGVSHADVQTLDEFSTVLSNTIDKGLGNTMQQRAGITLAHLKKLKQAISVIVCLKKRIQREERKSDGASSHQLPEDPQAQQGEEEGGGGLRPDAHDGLEVAREGGSGVALGAVPRLNLEAMENGAGRGGSDHLPPLDEDACRGLTETEKDHTQAEGPNSPSWREALAPWSMASPRDTTPGREAPRLDSSQAPRAAEGAGAPLSLRKDGSGQYGKAPRPKRQQEESPFPDHSYVTGFATHREPGRFMVEHRLKPDFQEMYGISFVPEGQKPWTPRGGLSAAPGTRQNAWTPISRSTRRSRSTPGSVPLLPTLPRARVALAGGWYTNRSHEVKGSPLLEEGVPVQTAAGRIRLNDEHSHTGVAKSADGNRFVLRPRCFSDTIIVS